MQAILDGICFLLGLAAFILCFITFQQQQPHLYYFPIPIIWIIIYPIIIELIYNLISNCSEKVNFSLSPTSRIVFHHNYNITFCGIQKLHPFDSQKYGNVYNRLIDMKLITEETVIKPHGMPRKILLQKMSKCYLLKMNYSICLCSYVQLPICFLPAFLLRWRLLTPMLLGTQGTILSSIAALKLRWSVNLSGGYHHASCTNGGGFCIYPDITLAIHYLQTRHNIEKVMIIDLDAHQGNGHERDHLNREDIFIVDAYNHDIYPNDDYAKKAITKDIEVKNTTSSQNYITKLLKIEEYIKNYQPNFVMYNAGTDCLIGDPLGDLSISKQGIILRDQTIFRMCLKNNVPICMVLSGGYQKINAKVIADSIKNLYDKFDTIQQQY